MSTAFTDQSEKFLFWRNAAQRAAYLRAYAVIWTSEVWIRDMKDAPRTSINQCPIIGEKLHIVGADVDDGREMLAFNIQRSDATGKPILDPADEKEINDETTKIFFVKPILAAMKAVRR